MPPLVEARGRFHGSVTVAAGAFAGSVSTSIAAGAGPVDAAGSVDITDTRRVLVRTLG